MDTAEAEPACRAARGVAWRGVAWRGVAWRGVVCRTAPRRGVNALLETGADVGGK